LATEAATQFIAQLDGADQVGVVWFNESAAVEQPLSLDHNAAVEALRRIPLLAQTRLDAGVAAARGELSSGRHRVNARGVVIIMTDGKANPAPIGDAEVEAQLVKAAGITIFVIGWGVPAELDGEALRRMASKPEYYMQTPDPDELGRIYKSIVAAIPCAADPF
jgi:Mg-chelatase subunit ChlD